MVLPKFARTFARHFSSVSPEQSCPFCALGVPKNSSYKHVKNAFLALALKHHPDTSEDKGASTRLFIKILSAFDQIKELPNGTAALRDVNDRSDAYMTSEKFESWFFTETGKHSPNISSHGRLELSRETIREISEMTKVMDCGGLDRGGMWDLAKTISQNVKDNGNEGGGILQLDCRNFGNIVTKRRRRG